MINIIIGGGGGGGGSSSSSSSYCLIFNVIASADQEILISQCVFVDRPVYIFAK